MCDVIMVGNAYVDDVVKLVSSWILGRGLELLRANSGRFEINLLSFADGTAQVADSERSCVDWPVNLGEYVKEIVASECGQELFYGVLKQYERGSNECVSRRRTVTGSGFF